MSNASASSSLIRPYAAIRLLSDVRREKIPLIRSAKASLALSPRQDEIANHAIASASPTPRMIQSGNRDEDTSELSARLASMLRDVSDGVFRCAPVQCDGVVGLSMMND